MGAALKPTAYFLVINDEQCGPLSASDVKKLRLDGTASNSTLVWTEGMADWLPLSELSELSTQFPPKPNFTSIGRQPAASGASGVSRSKLTKRESSNTEIENKYILYAIFGSSLIGSFLRTLVLPTVGISKGASGLDIFCTLAIYFTFMNADKRLLEKKGYDISSLTAISIMFCPAYLFRRYKLLHSKPKWVLLLAWIQTIPFILVFFGALSALILPSYNRYQVLKSGSEGAAAYAPITIEDPVIAALKEREYGKLGRISTLMERIRGNGEVTWAARGDSFIATIKKPQSISLVTFTKDKKSSGTDVYVDLTAISINGADCPHEFPSEAAICFGRIAGER